MDVKWLCLLLCAGLLSGCAASGGGSMDMCQRLGYQAMSNAHLRCLTSLDDQTDGSIASRYRAFGYNLH